MPFCILESDSAIYLFQLFKLKTTQRPSKSPQKTSITGRMMSSLRLRRYTCLAICAENQVKAHSPRENFSATMRPLSTRQLYCSSTMPRLTFAMSQGQSCVRARVLCQLYSEARVRTARSICFANTMRGQLNCASGDVGGSISLRCAVVTRWARVIVFPQNFPELPVVLAPAHTSLLRLLDFST